VRLLQHILVSQIQSSLQYSYPGGSRDSSRLAHWPAKLQPFSVYGLQCRNVSSASFHVAFTTVVFDNYLLSPSRCRYQVVWTPPPVSISSQFLTSLCVVVYDDDTLCTNNTIGLASPPVCLPLSLPAPHPRWTEKSGAQPIAANGTFPVFVGTVGCRSFFVAAAEDMNYDVFVRADAKLPPDAYLFSRYFFPSAYAHLSIANFKTVLVGAW
jgi:hypothetical protein